MIQPRPFPGSTHVSPSGCRRSLTLDECAALVPGDEVLISIDPRVFTVVSNDQETFRVSVEPAFYWYGYAPWELLQTLVETETV